MRWCFGRITTAAVREPTGVRQDAGTRAGRRVLQLDEKEWKPEQTRYFRDGEECAEIGGLQEEFVMHQLWGKMRAEVEADSRVPRLGSQKDGGAIP